MPFAFSVTEPHMRIATTVMLMLSSINFKIAVTTKIPIVSYLTVLDKYALPALIYLGSLCSYHSIIGSNLFNQLPVEKLIFIDRLAMCCIASTYFSFNFSYLIYFIYKVIKQKMAKNEFLYRSNNSSLKKTIQRV